MADEELKNNIDNKKRKKKIKNKIIWWIYIICFVLIIMLLDNIYNLIKYNLTLKDLENEKQQIVLDNNDKSISLENLYSEDFIYRYSINNLKLIPPSSTNSSINKEPLDNINE